MKNKTKLVTGALSVLIVSPIWYYLLYQILTRVNASELMFFLFWVYLPAGIVGQIVTKLLD